MICRFRQWARTAFVAGMLTALAPRLDDWHALARLHVAEHTLAQMLGKSHEDPHALAAHWEARCVQGGLKTSRSRGTCSVVESIHTA